MTDPPYAPETGIDADSPWLRPIGPGDQETLRSWRNANTSRFYNQNPVSADRQQAWYENHLGRPDDHMFLVMDRNQAIGCIGIRFCDDSWHLYNVIRGVTTLHRMGYMSRALVQVMDFARKTRDAPVRAEVLADNPALGWYQRNGFTVQARTGQAILMMWHGERKHPQEAIS
jgi:RimJ/RimL family protein N-acetyltransferase